MAFGWPVRFWTDCAQGGFRLEDRKVDRVTGDARGAELGGEVTHRGSERTFGDTDDVIVRNREIPARREQGDDARTVAPFEPRTREAGRNQQ